MEGTITKDELSAISGLSIRFEVGRDIFKVDSYGGRPTDEGSAYFVITFLGGKANNSEVRCFNFHISTRETNMLVRLVRCVNFRCHFVSEVAGDNHRLPATNDSLVF